MTNYTHGQGYWINDNTGENLTYWLWDYAWKTDPKYLDKQFWKHIGVEVINTGIQGDILKDYHFNFRMLQPQNQFNLKVTEKDRGGSLLNSAGKEWGTSICTYHMYQSFFGPFHI